MISVKRLIQMARKWQKMAAGRRIKRISYAIRSDSDHMNGSAANKGYFVVYRMDQKRFVVPIEYLSSKVFKELLKWSEEEFGLPSNATIMMPIDSIMLDYIISLVGEHVPEDVEKALISSMPTCHSLQCSSYLVLTRGHQQPIIYGF